MKAAPVNPTAHADVHLPAVDGVPTLTLPELVRTYRRQVEDLAATVAAERRRYTVTGTTSRKTLGVLEGSLQELLAAFNEMEARINDEPTQPVLTSPIAPGLRYY